MDNSYLYAALHGKKAICKCIIFLLTIICTTFIILSIKRAMATEKINGSSESGSLRQSILAGTWYPGSPAQLSKVINSYLKNAKKQKLNGKITGVVVPHAGYRYSGQVAAYAYKNLVNTGVKRVIMVGPSHRFAFRGVSVNLKKGYVTPLGVVSVDKAMAEKILRADPAIHWVNQAHEVEHSLEIELPFLQTVLKDFSIVPILMGQQDYETCSVLADILVRVMKTHPNTLLLASSDLSHYHSYDRARTLDSRFISYIKEMDPEGLYKALRGGDCEACGGGPVIVNMLVCRMLGATAPVVLKYANSGDVTGDHRSVVGYVSAVFVKPFDKGPHQ